jgi:hypothetical protein
VLTVLVLLVLTVLEVLFLRGVLGALGFDFGFGCGFTGAGVFVGAVVFFAMAFRSHHHAMRRLRQ